MIYLDNAATSRFKPQSVIECLLYDLKHSANSGRSGHKDAIAASLKIEECRRYLLQMLNGGNEHEIIFTKNCTEALNLAIFSSAKQGSTVLTTANEHNALLRPLFELKQRNIISLDILPTGGKNIDLTLLKERAKFANIIAIGGASNVTGATADLFEIGKIAKAHDCLLIVDGAQSVPIVPTDLAAMNIDMLACPGHKGLHGIQGTGFLAVRKNRPLHPLLFGGTGTNSQSETQPLTLPDGFEAGTVFAGGIAALKEGAKWTTDNIVPLRKKIKRLADDAAYNLKNIGATVYEGDLQTGIISFNLKDCDSSHIADILDENDIAVRAGIHCSPLIHKELGTLTQGAIRISLGVDNKASDILRFSKTVERIMSKLK